MGTHEAIFRTVIFAMPATELILSPATLPDDAIEVARIADAWGVKGWFKVFALSSDPQALLKAKHWFIQPPEKGARHFQGVASLEMRQARFHGDGMVGWAQGVDDRDQAEKLKGARVFISRAEFPKTDDDEYYWVDLMGLTVVNREGLELGTVNDLMATGPQTVLVVGYEVEGEAQERLIPFVNAFVDEVSLPNKRITVDWQPDY